MQSVGTRLREAREKKGFSLHEINARTCINEKNLLAIEHDEVRKISSPFFYRSFVRQYAEQVDLDFNSLSLSVETLAGHMRQPDLPGQGEHQPVRVPPVRAREKRDFSWLRPAALFFVGVALSSLTIAGWKHYAPLTHRTAVAVLPVPTIAPRAVIAPEVESLRSPVNDKIHLELSATEPTWLSITADGKPAYTGTLEPAETKVLDGQDIARLRTGNAGGVTIHFNGKDLGAIGPRGKSRTVVFTRTGYFVQAPQDSSLVRADHIGG